MEIISKWLLLTLNIVSTPIYSTVQRPLSLGPLQRLRAPGPALSFSARAGWPHGGSRVFPESGREVPPTALGFCPVSGWQCSLPRAGEPGDA